MRWAIQVMEEARDQAEAEQMLDGLALQGGYLGGRVLAPSETKPGWRVQGFMQDEPEAAVWLPDGMRRVVLPPGTARVLGIEG